MVDISHETLEEMHIRLRRVIRAAELKLYDESYAFAEFPLDQFPGRIDPRALAVIRDDEVWSQLIPNFTGSHQSFAVFRFHFPAMMDNSGFVGWLATHLKQRFDTGIFVVCGQNSGRGGIFDYWGCPWGLAEEVILEIRLLAGMSTDGGIET